MDIDERTDYLESVGLELGWNKGLVKCQICHDRWHRADYETCYDCRPPWLYFSRREFTSDQRMEIMERDDYRCSACGAHDEYIQIDHIMPCMRGGEADLWNGQVLCAKCNWEKAGQYWNTKWPERRNELIHFYLTFGWSWLSFKEQDLLVAEASNKRELIGYEEFLDSFPTVWLERESEERKIIITQSYPPVHFQNNRLVLSKMQGPVPEYVAVGGSWEIRRLFQHGDKFLWHTHVSNRLSEPPQWAINMADLCPDECECHDRESSCL